jgi:hypothetical protein
VRFCLLILTLLTACTTATNLKPVPPCEVIGFQPVEGAAGPRDARFPIRVENNSLVLGDKVLAGPFLAIDSFDVSASRGEVVFSAKRKDSFDVGLVAVEGSEIKWVPEDPADEVAVKWAPRGNKISFVIRATGGDLVRTVHIPTGMDLVVAFPWARITSLIWDVAAERYTVVYSTPDASARTEVARYGGEERTVVTPPASRLDVTVEPIGPDAIVLRPNDLRYGERVPVVIWVDTSLYHWNVARAALMRNARVAIVIAKSANAELKEPWMDPARVFAVGSLREGAMSIVPDPAIPAGHYRESGPVLSVAPALVQSLAVCTIADQLKRTSPTNGSSR